MKQISFIIILLTILSLKNLNYLIVVISILWLVSIKDSLIITKRVIKSIFLFNLGISIAYLIMAIFRDIDLFYVCYINLKVFIMTYFVFWFFSKNNMVKFFSFSKDLSYLLTISLSQIYSYKKTFEDFKLAYKTRVIKKLKKREEGFIIKTFDFFLKKVFKDSKERSLALKARGFFDD